MHKVKNKKVITHLANSSMKQNRKKNIISLLAIILTCVLFTCLFSITASMEKSFQESTMRQVGSCRMASVKCIRKQDYDRLLRDPEVKNASYSIMISDAENEALLKVRTEIRYAQNAEAESSFCYPTTGHMPKKYNEIATSTLVLDALKVPHKIGATIPLEFKINGKKYQENFILSGYWKGDIAAMAQQCYLSKAYCDKALPSPEKSFYDTDGSNYTGYRDMQFDFSNSFNIEKQTQELLKRNGFDLSKQDYGINWAFMTGSVEPTEILGFAAILLLILLSGYLIIYNVFYIRISGDIRYYGLLKTVGTTGKQLKKMVRHQAFTLSLFGIPAGLLIGTIISRILFPIFISTFQTNVVQFYIHPLIYLFAAMFTLLTVWISCFRPCRKAAKVSPIEALKFTEVQKSRKKQKKSHHVTPLSMAFSNLGRNRKKAVLVILSLSLSLILLNLIYTAINSFDKDLYLSNLVAGDFVVGNASIENFTSDLDCTAITKKQQKELQTLDGVTDSACIYCDDINSNTQMTETTKKQLIKSQKKSDLEQYQKDEGIHAELKKNYLETTLYGIDEMALDMIQSDDDDIDKKQFLSGDYALVQVDSYYEDPATFTEYVPGKSIDITLPDGTTKSYKIMATGTLPYSLTTKRYGTLGLEVILPSSEFLSHTKETGALYTVLNVDKAKNTAIDHMLKQYTNGTTLTYTSKQTYVKEFQDFINMIWAVGGTLCILLGLLGLLNFINAIVTSMLSRSQEFAMMQAVGMTGRQLSKMVMWEGLLYAVFTMVFSLFFTCLLSNTLVSSIAGATWFFTYHFSLLPLLICIPFLLLFACLIPYLACKKMQKKSVVERLRTEE